MEKAPAPLPTMEDLQQRDPETLQPGIWERAKGWAENTKYHLYNLASAGQGFKQTNLQEVTRQRLLNLQEKLKGKKTNFRVIGTVGAVAAGMASVFVASPATAANLAGATNKVVGGIEGFDASAVDLSDPNTYTDPIGTLQGAIQDDNEQTIASAHRENIIEPAQTHESFATPEEAHPDLIDQLASQIGLEQSEDGKLHTQGLSEYGDAKEGELYKSGTAYNEVEHIMRGMGYTTEDIQKLDESGEYHDIVRQFLHENNITYADEASSHPDMMLDTEISSGHQFDVSQEFLARIHDTNPPEISADQLVTPGLDETQKNDLDNAVGAMSDEEIQVLYNGVDVDELPAASEVDSVSDLPVPETAEDRQKLAENLEALTEKTTETPAEFIGEDKSFWNDSWNEEAIVIGSAALLAAGSVGAGILSYKKKNRRHRNTPVHPEITPELAAEIERRRQENQARWWDNQARWQAQQAGLAAPAPEPTPAPTPNANTYPVTHIADQIPEPPAAPVYNSPLDQEDFEVNDTEAAVEEFNNSLNEAIEEYVKKGRLDGDEESRKKTQEEFKKYLIANSAKTFDKLYAAYEIEDEDSETDIEQMRNKFGEYLKEEELYAPYSWDDPLDMFRFQFNLEELLDEFLANKAKQQTQVEDKPAERRRL